MATYGGCEGQKGPLEEDCGQREAGKERHFQLEWRQ
jgi:hypothetical protein